MCNSCCKFVSVIWLVRWLVGWLAGWFLFYNSLHQRYFLSCLRTSCCPLNAAASSCTVQMTVPCLLFWLLMYQCSMSIKCWVSKIPVSKLKCSSKIHSKIVIDECFLFILPHWPICLGKCRVSILSGNELLSLTSTAPSRVWTVWWMSCINTINTISKPTGSGSW